MCQRLEPGQSEKPAGTLDRVNKAEDVFENFDVVRLLLEAHQLHIDKVEAFAGLRQELAQQVVHGNEYFRRNTRPDRSESRKAGTVCCETV